MAISALLGWAMSYRWPAAAPVASPVAPPVAVPVLGQDVYQPTPLRLLTQQLATIQAELAALQRAYQPARAPEIDQYHPNGEDQGYYNGSANCGPTSMAMIARAFGWGGDLSDAKLINSLGAAGGTTAEGTSVNGIVAMARAIGKSGEIKQGADAAWIRDQLEGGHLVVANGDYYAMAPHDNGRNIGQGGHYVAVIGLEGDRFIVNDPADKNVHLVSGPDLETFIRSNRNGGYQIAVG
ncbi:MAG: hypothetical protein JWM80_6053 [Cyanobacteria bacterium RYN_339]|nr:hypothetical protein [Cyanobacteria bacterium RYN_339]